MKQFFAGNSPILHRVLRPVVLSGTGVKLTVWATPEYLSIGSTDDYFRFPLSPLAGRFIGDRYDLSLPTRTIVNAITKQADVKVWAYGLVTNPATADKDMRLMKGGGFYWFHNEQIDGELVKQGKYDDDEFHLLGGPRKEPVISKYAAEHPKAGFPRNLRFARKSKRRYTERAGS